MNTKTLKRKYRAILIVANLLQMHQTLCLNTIFAWRITAIIAVLHFTQNRSLLRIYFKAELLLLCFKSCYAPISVNLKQTCTTQGGWKVKMIGMARGEELLEKSEW